MFCPLLNELQGVRKMRNNKPLILTDFLSVGEENAITAKSLAKILGWNEREITIAVNALRKQGVFICSSGSGFYLPADDRDIERFVRGMRGRMRDMQRAITPAIDYLKNGGGDIDTE